MKIRFHKQFLLEYSQWEFSQKSVQEKINSMIDGIVINPFITIGKLGRLKYCENVYSREITKKDRLVYKIDEDKIMLLSCMGHYE